MIRRNQAPSAFVHINFHIHILSYLYVHLLYSLSLFLFIIITVHNDNLIQQSLSTTLLSLLTEVSV